MSWNVSNGDFVAPLDAVCDSEYLLKPATALGVECDDKSHIDAVVSCRLGCVLGVATTVQVRILVALGAGSDTGAGHSIAFHFWGFHISGEIGHLGSRYSKPICPISSVLMSMCTACAEQLYNKYYCTTILGHENTPANFNPFGNSR